MMKQNISVAFSVVFFVFFYYQNAGNKHSLKYKMFGGEVDPQTPALIFEILYLIISQGW